MGDMKPWEFVPVCITVGAFGGVLVGLASFSSPRIGAAIGIAVALAIGTALHVWQRYKERK